ncbi:MAG: VanZ family protein [Lachnospiraceae bacterium]|jgi:VanZ family protein|nr:VanZ family protein [Lachnospiraceae bacterium]
MKNSLKKYLSWIPPFLIATAIFIFSSQPADESTSTSNGVIHILIEFAGKLNILDLKHADPDALYKILQTPIRKGAHITEFAVLNLSLIYALSSWNIKGMKLIRTAFLLTVLYACTDEFHQIFVPGRAGLIQDVLIDSIGPMIILGSYILYQLLKKRTIFFEKY